MAGSGNKKRHRMACIHAYRLKEAGMTHREIASAIGCRVEQVAERVRVGERFADDPALDTIKSTRPAVTITLKRVTYTRKSE